VAFWASGKLKKIALDGGTPVDICDIPDLLGGTWGEDGDIVGSSGRDLWKVSANGGSPKSLDVMGSWPEHVQGSPVLLYTAGTVTHDIAAFSPRDAQHRVLVRGATYPRYLPDRYHSGGYLLYVNNGTLFAVRFDPLQLEIKGRAAAILQDVSYSDTFGSAQFDVSRDGTLIYRSAPGHGQVTAQWLNARGQLKPLLSKPDAYSWPKLSPDGTRIVFVLDRGDSHDVWSYDSSRGQMTKLISASYNAMAPRWTPDGRFVVFGAARNGVMTVSADGSGKEHLATKHEWLQVPGGFSPDGKYLALHQRVSGPFQIWIAPVQQESDALLISPPEPFHQSNTFETYPSFSDDGHWIAYTSIDSGTYEVYVRAFPDNGSVRQVSVGGGTQGIWAGHKLFYRRNDNRLMVLTYHTNAGKFVADPPRLWSDVQIADTGVLPNFDASLDGRHVVVLMPATLDTLRRTHVTFLIHFTDLLRERIPGPRR
jgi:serine/threonine-protein kinase